MKDVCLVAIITIASIITLYLFHDKIQKTVHEHLNLEEYFRDSLMIYGRE